VGLPESEKEQPRTSAGSLARAPGVAAGEGGREACNRRQRAEFAVCAVHRSPGEALNCGWSRKCAFDAGKQAGGHGVSQQRGVPGGRGRREGTQGRLWAGLENYTCWAG